VSFGRVVFVDTSVLDEILDVPGWSQDPGRLQTEFAERVRRGEQLIIPASALIETGNHISQSTGNRRAAAVRYEKLIAQLVTQSAPWRANNLQVDVEFLTALRDGAGTGQTLTNLLASRQLGGGDLAVLVEARQFAKTSYGFDVEIWTCDRLLEAFWLMRG
jgi:hypothetical protein